ncbi:MAG: DNA polymerase I [Candidatus Binatia bacterium]
MAQTNAVLYLVDASSYVYRAFFALPPLTSPTGLPVNAVYGFTTMLVKLLRQTQPQYIGIVFDAPGRTFRDDLFESYKANRPAMPDDLAAQFPLVQEVVQGFALPALSISGVEADDVIATVTEHMAAQDVETVIITGDKDLMQLVGARVRLWDTMRDRWCDSDAVRRRFGVRPEQVVEVLGLMGDTTDNIPGIKGIGEKTAAALIQRFGTIECLLSRLDELEAGGGIRGARKLAATLRANADRARLSRNLAVVRRDVALDCPLERFRYQGPDPAALRPIFTRFGFQTLVRELAAGAAEVSVPLQRAEREAQGQALLAAARRRGRLAFASDAGEEHDRVHAKGVVVQADPGQPVYLRLDRDWQRELVATLLAAPQVEKITHDLKRDLLLLSNAVRQPVRPAFDLMLASYLLQASATHRLEDIAANELGAHMPAFPNGLAVLASGVSLFARLRDRFATRLHEWGMERLFYEVEMPLVAVLAAMEQRGVRVDVAALAAMGQEMETRLRGLMQEIYELAGQEFNIASPPQLREVLFERLGLSRQGVRRGKTGLSTDVDVLTRLATEHPLPAKILAFRALAKLKSTYVDALPAAANPQTGRLHASFNQAVTATGRLSSSEPNLQNIPIRGEEGRRIRAAFVADEGCVLVVADYSQIELRILAHLSEDPVLVAAFRAGEDVHTRTATEVFGVLPGAVSPEMRRAAKVINFGILYGMGPQRLARELGIPVAEAQRYIASYFGRYPGVRVYLAAVQHAARQCGYVTTLLGRRRALPDLSSPHRGVAQAAARAAANTPIQGSAADLIKMAMVALDRRLAAEGVRGGLILQVHDELVFEVSEADRDRTIAIVRDEMEGVFPLTVPLRIDLGWGRNWAAAH